MQANSNNEKILMIEKNCDDEKLSSSIESGGYQDQF